MGKLPSSGPNNGVHHMTLNELVKVFNLFGQNTSRLGLLFREQKMISGNTMKGTDSLPDILNETLDKLMNEVGREL